MHVDDITTRTQLADALSQLRKSRGLTVRELARRLEVPSGTLGDYFSGRHVPSAAQRPLMRRLLAELGVDGDSDRWIAALIRVRGSFDRRITRSNAPYRGLGAFEADDAEMYFGRRQETDELVERVRALRIDPGPSRGITAVVGPSGSGKSSLLRAGLVATLRAEGVRCAVTTPVSGPLPTGEEVVVVDQFEELFTSHPDPAGYLTSLVKRDPSVPVVLGLRADFYAAAATEPSVLAALQHAQLVVGPMGEPALREAILEPARRSGLAVEDGWAELVLADFRPRDAGALPLLSHALRETWERATGGRLTIAGYRATGGIDAAVQRTAENVYASLQPTDQDIARQLFVRLVNLDDIAVTRRRMSRSELDERSVQVLEPFIAARLVTADQDSVQITHEALLSAWPRLRGWLDADRSGLRLHRQITDGANAWARSGHEPGLLLRAARLGAAVEWAADTDRRAQLNALERDYLDASTAEADAEAVRERRRVRRLRQLLAVLAVLVIAAGLLAGYAFRATSIADRERTNAAQARDDALSRQIAFQSRALQDTDPALAEQLALVAYDIAPTDTARGAVIDESARPVITRVLGAQGPTALGLSPNGGLIAVSHADDGSVHLYATGSGRAPRALGVAHLAGDGRGQVFALAFSPDGRTLAAGGEGGHVHLWDVSDPSHPRSLSTLQPAFGAAVESIAFSPDGRTLAAGSAGSHPILRWNVTDPAVARSLPVPQGVPATETVQAVAFSPDGSMFAAGGSTGSTLLWPAAHVASASPRTLGSAATVDAIAFAANSRTLVTGDRSGLLDVWALAGTPRVTRHMQGENNSQINTVAISPDGTQAAVGSSDNTLRQWDLTDGTAIATTDNPGPVTGTAYSPDGRTLLTTAADGTLRLWAGASRLVPVGAGTVFTDAFPRAGSLLAVATNGASSALQLWDLADPDDPEPVGPQLHMATGIDGAAAIRPDARLLAAGDSAGHVQLWDVANPERPHAIGTPFTAAGALVETLTFSPDGRLLAVGADDNTADIWDVHDPAHPRRIAVLRTGGLVLNTAFSADGTLLAAASADDHAYLWDIRYSAHPVQLARLGGFANYVYGVSFSPNGRLLAVSSADHTTRMWDISNPRRPHAVGGRLTGPSDYALLVTFSHDGRLLAVASNDRTVWVYDVHDPRHPVAAETLRALNGNVFAVAFSPDDRTLVAGGRAPSLAVWTTDPAAYAKGLCALAGDPITRAEWAQYVPGARYDPPCS